MPHDARKYTFATGENHTHTGYVYNTTELQKKHVPVSETMLLKMLRHTVLVLSMVHRKWKETFFPFPLGNPESTSTVVHFYLSSGTFSVGDYGNLVQPFCETLYA